MEKVRNGMRGILPPPVPIGLFFYPGIGFIEWIFGSCLTNSPVFWNKADCSFQSAAGSVSEPTQRLWQGGKCVGECEFEAMRLRKADGDGGACGERGDWMTHSRWQTDTNSNGSYQCFTRSLFSHGLWHPPPTPPPPSSRGCRELAGLCSPLRRKEAAKHWSPHI